MPSHSKASKPEHRPAGLQCGPGRRTRPAAALLLTSGVLLASLGLPGVSGCSRELTFGPAGEPAGSRQPTWLRFTIEADPVHATAARFYASEFAAIGVRAGVEVRPRESIVRRALAGQSDACLIGWSGRSPDPVGLPAAKLIPGGSENLSGYDCPEVGRLLAGVVGRQSAEDKAASARAAQEFLFEEAPWVFGVSHPLFDAAAATLSGWRPGPSGAVDLRDASFQDRGERLVVGLGLAEPPFIDPFGAIDPQAGVVYRCLFDALASAGPDGSLQPELAEKWELSTNGRRLTVELRPGVVFHNGEPLRAEDVVFSYEKALVGRLPEGLGVHVSAEGPSTVVFQFSAPFGGFLDLFGLQPVVPAAYYKAVGPEGFSTAPVGTGAFRCDPQRAKRQFLLVRWDGYYGGFSARGPARPAILGEVVFVFVPDPARRLAMLKAGQIALAPTLLPAAAEVFRGGATVVPEPGFNSLALELNTRRPPFSDARVRIALNLAVNREALAQACGPGATPLPTAFFPEGFGYAVEAGGFRLDQDRARSLLRGAGYLVLAPGGQ